MDCNDRVDLLLVVMYRRSQTIPEVSSMNYSLSQIGICVCYARRGDAMRRK